MPANMEVLPRTLMKMLTSVILLCVQVLLHVFWLLSLSSLNNFHLPVGTEVKKKKRQLF
jgi:hypothetical protein